MLSWVYSHEYAHGFNPRPGSLDRALVAARRAVDLAPSNPLAQQASLFPSSGFRAIAIFLITFTGDWERGCALIRRAIELNPHHPRCYELILAINEHRHGSYRAAMDETVRANLPENFWKSLSRLMAGSASWMRRGTPCRTCSPRSRTSPSRVRSCWGSGSTRSWSGS